jgi:hypothetical protein
MPTPRPQHDHNELQLPYLGDMWTMAARPRERVASGDAAKLPRSIVARH